ncbi:MAG: SH3 domain-containing protein [Gemmatimonadota bacterium]
MSKLTRLTTLLLPFVVTAWEGRALAQEYVVAVAEENFRARPNGTKLGTLKKGATLAALDENGRWVKASLRGWIWKKSVAEGSGKSGLRVSVERENLRASASASGRLIGTVLRGTQMTRLAARGGWVRVQYDGWVWQPSLAEGDPAVEDAEAAEATAWRPDRTLSVAEENLRAAPNGTRLGTLERGADLRVLGSRGSWLSVSTRGWFWAASTRGSGSSRSVARPVENLRVAPGSAIAGVLTRGTPLRVVGSAGKWLEVEVRGWMWEPSTRALRGAAEVPSASARAGGGEAAPTPPATSEAGQPAAPPRTLARSIPLRDGPEGELVAQALTGSQVVTLREQGDWVKVRVEGWVPKELVTAGAPDPGGAPPGPVTVGRVAADPERYRGAAATWTLELIAVERADETRRDFGPGEHYLLTRNVSGEREYVYVVIPPRLEEGFRKLRPFTTITVRGVVRTGRSALVGNPILEYRELLDG